MSKRKPASKSSVPRNTIFVDADVPRKSYAQQGLKYYGEDKKKSALMAVAEAVGKAVGVKPAKPRLPAVPSSVVQAPPPSRSRGKEIHGRVLRKK